MKDFFLQFPATSSDVFMLKLALFPLLTMVVYYLCYTILMKTVKENKVDSDSMYGRFEIRSTLFKVYSALFCVIPLNIYWFYVIRNLQNLDAFAWHLFPIGLANTYFQLLPFFLSVMVIGWLYVSNIKKIQNIL